MALLELEGVSKAFGGVRAVSGVSFTVDEGELVGVMGPNGSGKTTLFNLITGALRPDAGRIRLAGRDITGWSPHRVCAEGITRTFQHVRPFAGLSALENVRKRLELARALATAPHLLLLDELMAGLSPVETEGVMALLRRLQREGVTILMVEHIVWALLDLSRRVIVLSAGEKIAEGPPDAVAADPTVVDVYLGAGAGGARRA